MREYKKFTIVSNEHVGENVYKMILKGKLEGKPGQFYMLRAWHFDPILSRPFSICDLTEDSITFLYMVVGRGTKLFSELESGREVSLLGPLGNGFELVENKKVALVSGSVGNAPMYYLAKALKEKNCEIDLYTGFADYDFFTDEFKEVVDNIYISSDHGKVGFHGNVVQLMKEKNKEYDEVCGCGPIPMLRALKMAFPEYNIQLSMEARMACGFGACLGCAIETTSGIEKVCKDGPVFRSEEVVFNA